MAGPRVWTCAEGADAFGFTGNLLHAGGEEPTFIYPQCAPGNGEWIEVEALGIGSPATPAAVTPEQALVQVAMVGSVAFVGLKGLAIGLMR